MDFTQEMDVLQFRTELEHVDELLVITGAGASADSGIPTFRGSSNSWWTRAYGFLIMAVFGTAEGWYLFPSLCWIFFDRWFRRPVMRAQPNACHRFFGELSKQEGKWVRIITQNVDGMHQRGGLSTEHVAEIHGTIWRIRCVGCGKILKETVPIANMSYHKEDDYHVPYCDCVAQTIFHNKRPDVTLFHEQMPENEMNKAVSFINEMSNGWNSNSMVLLIGTSGQVNTIYPLLSRCHGKNKKIVLIDPNPTEDMKHCANVVVRETAQNVFS